MTICFRCQRLEHINLEECNQLMRPTFFRLCGHFTSHLMSLSLDNCEKVTDEIVKVTSVEYFMNETL